MALFDRPALLAGAGAALAGWGIVAVPVLLLWVTTPYADGDLTAVPQLAAALWLLAQGGPLRWDGAAGHASLGVAPLLVTALAVGLVHHAAARAGRRREVVLGYLGVAVPAALLGLGSEPRTEPVPDLLWTGLLALLAAIAGAHRSTGEWGLAAAWRAVRARGEWLGVWPVPTPEGVLARRMGWLRGLAPQRDEALRAGLTGALALLGGGAAVLTASILVHPGAAGTSAALLAPDLAGRVSLMLLCAVLVPNAAVWAGAYALGTGFTLGGHAAALGSQPLAPLALPLLADAPGPGRSVFGLLALAVPLASGGAVGWALTRDVRVVPTSAVTPSAVPRPEDAADGEEPSCRDVGPTCGWTALALVVLGASACTGLLAGVGARWAGGTLGDGALAEVGPPVGWTALAAFCWTFAVGLPTAFLLRWSRSRMRAPRMSPAPAPDALPAEARAGDAVTAEVHDDRAHDARAHDARAQDPRTQGARAHDAHADHPRPVEALTVASAIAAVIDGADWGFPAEEPDRGPSSGSGSSRSPSPGPGFGLGLGLDVGLAVDRDHEPTEPTPGLAATPAADPGPDA
ncbi:cell division protein PerM [Streptacidiphilus neutrinimicus]|uniref:cell division protein PerM n=1 Tax=Streptacidiphilus neutrinimicus TaxID=105420 RepID=UPI0005A8A888|nr:DUF6350 family protein [Streptacidiphilus neutrinimicus]